MWYLLLICLFIVTGQSVCLPWESFFHEELWRALWGYLICCFVLGGRVSVTGQQTLPIWSQGSWVSVDSITDHGSWLPGSASVFDSAMPAAIKNLLAENESFNYGPIWWAAPLGPRSFKRPGLRADGKNCQMKPGLEKKMRRNRCLILLVLEQVEKGNNWQP